MTNSTSVFEFRSEFGDFLYASIDGGGNGGLLSVLSVLARLNVDPWQEAASLAQMPRENATQRLASLIATPSGGPSAYQDANAVAARLVTLLPHDGNSNLALREALPAIDMPSNLRAIVYLIIFNLIFMAIAFGSHYFVVGAQPPAQPAHAHVSVAHGATPKASPLAK